MYASLQQYKLIHVLNYVLLFLISLDYWHDTLYSSVSLKNTCYHPTNVHNNYCQNDRIRLPENTLCYLVALKVKTLLLVYAGPT